MVSTPEEFAIDLSRASLHAQAQTENQLREKATTVLSAASIVVPIAALAVGHGPAGARACGAALFPQDVRAGLLGSELLALGVTIVS
jgi:hypothetical protein